MKHLIPQMDWQQVALNGGPPCFFVEGPRFCGRAERWQGHGDPECHGFISLDAYVRLMCEKAKLDGRPAPDKGEAKWIVSVVMCKQGHNVVNTQNKLYELSAASLDEAKGKAMQQAQTDFPQHYLHTICGFNISRPIPAPDAIHRAAEKLAQTQLPTLLKDRVEMIEGIINEELGLLTTKDGDA